MAGWLRRLLGRSDQVSLDPGRADLVVVVASFDDAEACSTALDRATALNRDEPAVLRHHLRIPAERVGQVCAIAAQEGYAAAETPTDAGDGLKRLLLQRVQLLDALHCAQERSRMVGLAQRNDGVADGWDALQPGSAH
ncbi:hypothetical protein [Nocardia arthritidis]|uniref:Uncharacterized protein n=1 Tax=Nocardia arthritidis TaxID=228602 RepID=A0A6G9YCW0_9NOCA|nr:hypothetical protein [Nocardia arthritidis]QIS10896.1 hypothetical protein F5544_15060 [Nocardia arthritidis]